MKPVQACKRQSEPEEAQAPYLMLMWNGEKRTGSVSQARRF